MNYYGRIVCRLKYKYKNKVKGGTKGQYIQKLPLIDRLTNPRITWLCVQLLVVVTIVFQIK